MIIKNGIVFTDNCEFQKTDVTIEEDRIAGVGKSHSQADIDASNLYIIPGLVEIHMHGAMGFDFSDGTDEAFSQLAIFLIQRGVTSFLATSMSLPKPRLELIFSNIRSYMESQPTNCSRMMGINMEGPYFSKARRGAQNADYLSAPSIADFSDLQKVSGEAIRTVAIAPELPGSMEFIEKVSPKAIISIAHTEADYKTAKSAFEHGASHVTHMFNGMNAFDKREPGVVGAAAELADYVEIIVDGFHLHPSMVRAVFKLFTDDRVCLISDAMRACGMPEGTYDLGDLTVTVSGGKATIMGGSLAGSTATLFDCFRNAWLYGLKLESVIKAATSNPAKAVGIYNLVGSITPGKLADLLILDKELHIQHIIKDGLLIK